MPARSKRVAATPVIECNDNDPARRFEMYPASALTIDRSCNYLIKGLMPSERLLVLYGPPGIGKSFLALDAAIHVAAGRDWAGCRVDKRGRGVVYVASEGARGFRQRVVAAIASRGIGSDIPFALIEEAPDLGSEGDLNRLIRDIKAQSLALGIDPALIVLDTLSRSIAQLNESDASGMNTFIANARTLSKTFGDALVMPVHHTGKDADRGMRGSSALAGAADAIWYLKVENGENTFELQKMKDGPSGFSKVFALKSYPLGEDDDGDAMSTLVVDAIGDPAAKKPSPAKPAAPDAAGGDLRLILAILAAEAKTGTARAAHLGDEVLAMPTRKLRASLKAGLMKDDPGLNKASLAVRISRHLGSLEDRGLLRTAGPWTWATSEAAEAEAGKH